MVHGVEHSLTVFCCKSCQLMNEAVCNVCFLKLKLMIIVIFVLTQLFKFFQYLKGLVVFVQQTMIIYFLR